MALGLQEEYETAVCFYISMICNDMVAASGDRQQYHPFHFPLCLHGSYLPFMSRVLLHTNQGSCQHFSPGEQFF
jgi:hypothetical protein